MPLIAIDARESGTTTGRYIDKLIGYLYKLKPDFDFVILTKSHRIDFIKKIAPSFTVVDTPYEEFSFGEQLGFNKQIKSLNPDLVHFGMVQQPVFYDGKVVTTMHDLTTARFKNPDKNPVVFIVMQTIYKWVNKRVARKSEAIITPTQFVRRDVASFAHINPDKITVTYESADWITDKSEPVKALTGKQFIMYIGRPSPHKNLDRLIEAFIRLRPDHPDLHLVLAGKKDTNYQRIEDTITRRGVRRIVFTDFVSEGQLKWLYGNCRAYVFPSLSEGFGLPGLEAMVHGAPVVSSNTTCLPEVYGDAARYFDPLDVSSMSLAINDVLTDRALREKLINSGRAQAKKYSWQRMAEQTLEVYRQTLSN